MQHSIVGLMVPADFISMLNTLFSFIAILLLIIPFIDSPLQYRLSLSFILLSLLADGLDGIIARRTKKGLLGPYLESMGDLSSAGIATSVFVFHRLYYMTNNQTLIIHLGLICLLSFYVFCCLLRLAAFHPLQTTGYFKGLPAPAASIVILLSSYISSTNLLIFPIILFVSLLMISSIHYIKPGKKMNSVTAVLIVLIILFNNSFYSIFILVFLFFLFCYIILAPFTSMRYLNKNHLQ